MLKPITLILMFITFALSAISLAAEPITATMESSIEGQIIFEEPLGAHVKKGQLVEQVNPTEYKFQLETDIGKYKDAKGYYDSLKPLVKNSVSRLDYIHDKYLYIEALYQCNIDKAIIERTKIYAPFDGIITKIYVYQGSGVGDGNDIMIITKS
ncbi:MAG: hypothetical protein GY756_22545 [bacterium]|nr:hypothetical protein [bacterium]